MANEIEKMSKMRSYIVRGLFFGSLVAFGVFMWPTYYSIFGVSKPYIQMYRFFEWGLLALAATILIFAIVYWLYKKKLKKDLALRAAVNDERVRRNWLKSYRFAFYMIITVTIVWKFYEIFIFNVAGPRRLMLPHNPWLTLFVATLSVTGAFLYLNREDKEARDD